MSQKETDYRSVVSSSGRDVLRIVARPPQPIRLYPRPKASCFADDGRPVEAFPGAPRSERLEPEIAALEERHFLGLSPYRRITLHAPSASEASTLAVRVHPDMASWARVQTQRPGKIQPLPPDDGKNEADGPSTGGSASETENEGTGEVIEVEVDSSGIGEFTLHIDRRAFLRHVEDVDPSDEDAWREHAEVEIEAATSADAFSADSDNGSGDRQSADAGSTPTATGDLHLLVQCNAATSIDAILERESLLVSEGDLFPAAETDNEPSASSSSVVALVQEALNQIVTRHGAAEVEFIPENGEYVASTCTSVRELLTHFGREEEEAFEYADANFGIQLDDSVADYVRRTYGVDAPATSGAVMDRRLLFGTGAAWTPGDPVENLDGLISLRTNLIGRFFEQIDAQAAPYLNANTFWLHRPEHSPYEEGDAVELTVTERTRLRTLPGATGDEADDAGATEQSDRDIHLAAQDATRVDLSGSRQRILQASPWQQDEHGATIWLDEGAPLTVREPTEAPFRDARTAEGDWYFVETGEGHTGWISAADDGPAEVTVRNDRVHDQNHGTYGGPGMAYSWGGKDRPDAYSTLLQENTPDPDTIQSWNQYQDGHRPGKTGSENDTVNWRGIDCSGFVQNVLTDARLWDEETPIVSRDVLVANRTTHDPEDLRELHDGEDGWERQWPHTYTRSAASFVAENADGDPFAPCTRTIPFDKTSRDTAYLNKGDVIANSGHVVIVGEEDPEVTNGTREQFDYTIYQARGVTVTRTKYYDGKVLKQNSEVPSDQFVRKVVASPMAWWASGILGPWFDQDAINEAEEEEREPEPKDPRAIAGRILFWK